MATGSSRALALARRVGLCGLCGLFGLGACRPGVPAPPEASSTTSLALGELARHLFVATGGELAVFEVSPRRGLGLRRVLSGPCDAYRDLDFFAHELFALCADGQVFARRASDYSEGEPLADLPWRPVDGVPEAAAGPSPAVALQRSDARLFAVRADGALAHVGGWGPPQIPRAGLDRLRGPDRGGPGEPPIAAFREAEAVHAHAFALRRRVALSASLERRGLACRVPGRARITDLAISRDGIAAVRVDRRGRARIILIDGGRAPYRAPFAGVYAPASGRPRGPAIVCWPP